MKRSGISLTALTPSENLDDSFTSALSLQAMLGRFKQMRKEFCVLLLEGLGKQRTASRLMSFITSTVQSVSWLRETMSGTSAYLNILPPHTFVKRK